MGDITHHEGSCLDPTIAPQDELNMTFNNAASASNDCNDFIAQTKGPDLFTLPLSAGVAVAGEIIDDANTVSTPFLPGDLILTCLLNSKPLLLSAHEDSLRLRIATRSALELPDSMSAETATSYLTALMVGAAMLKQELHIPVLRTPTASPTPAEDGGVGTYNHKRILVVGGETDLGAALVQLLHRALPDAKIMAMISIGDREELARRSAHMGALGAKSAVDGNTDDVSVHLPPSVDIIINAKKNEPVRKDVMGLLEGLQRFVDSSSLDVEAAVSTFLDDEPDCVTSLHELLLRAASDFSTTTEPSTLDRKRADSGIELA